MRKLCLGLAFISVLTIFSIEAMCLQTDSLSIGWRRDSLHWKTTLPQEEYRGDRIKDRICFEDINSYTITGKAAWLSSEYYIRFSADYGLIQKGRAHEHFGLKNSYFDHSADTHTNDPIKKQGELYDFDAAVGYPFCFCNGQATLIPLIGFSFHRQQFRVKEQELLFSSSDDFPLDLIDNSSAEIPHESANYRFTWYGVYIGADGAFALDCNWSLVGNLEVHFLDNCHRKRSASSGSYNFDNYHRKGLAYGYSGVVGVVWTMSSNCFANIDVDYKWWKGHSKHDDLYWKTVGTKIGLTYLF